MDSHNIIQGRDVPGETGSGGKPVIRSLATGCHCCLPKGSPQNTCVTAKIVAVEESFAGTIPHS